VGGGRTVLGREHPKVPDPEGPVHAAVLAHDPNVWKLLEHGVGHLNAVRFHSRVEFHEQHVAHDFVGRREVVEKVRGD